MWLCGLKLDEHIFTDDRWQVNYGSSWLRLFLFTSFNRACYEVITQPIKSLREIPTDNWVEPWQQRLCFIHVCAWPYNPPRAAIKLALPWRQSLPVLHQRGITQGVAVERNPEGYPSLSWREAPTARLSARGALLPPSHACTGYFRIRLAVISVEMTELFFFFSVSHSVFLPVCLCICPPLSLPLSEDILQRSL